MSKLTYKIIVARDREFCGDLPVEFKFFDEDGNETKSFEIRFDNNTLRINRSGGGFLDRLKIVPEVSNVICIE